MFRMKFCMSSDLTVYVCLFAGLMQQLCAILMASGVPADVLTEVSSFSSPHTHPTPFFDSSNKFVFLKIFLSL